MGSKRRRNRRARVAPTAGPSHVRLPALAVWGVFLIAALALYSGSYRNPLLFDDSILIPPSLERYLVAWKTFEPRWVAYGTFGLNYLASGMEVFWYRVVNVLLHAAVVIACYHFLLRLVKVGGLKTREPELAAFCASALFAVHPVAVYGVAYLAERSIVMATLFSVLALQAFLIGLERDQPKWMWASVLAYFFAVWSKENAVMVPAVVVAMTLLVRPPSMALAKRLAAPLFGFFVVALLITLRQKGLLGATYERYAGEIVNALPGGAAPSVSDAPERPVYGTMYLRSILGQAAYFFRYVGLWLLPYPGWMSGDIRVAFPRSVLEWPYLAGITLYLAWGAGALALLMRSARLRPAGFAMLVPWCLFLTEFAATRVQEPFVLYRGYLWMLGLQVAALVAAERLNAKVLVATGAAALVVLGVVTRERLDTFSTPLKFWGDVVQKNPDHSLPFVDRGLSNHAVAQMHEGRFAEAMPELDEAIRLNPLNAHGWINRGIVKSRLGDDKGGLQDADKALQLDPKFGEAYSERCTIRMKAGDQDGALDDCTQALKYSPDYPTALLNRGVLLAQRQRLDEALRDFDRILYYDPNNAIALYDKGMTLSQLRRDEEAKSALLRACQLGMPAACQRLKP